jgi:histidinol-phosphate/aromatic aminotransferase/cobyric acid decarboxylase-like protein
MSRIDFVKALQTVMSGRREALSALNDCLDLKAPFVVVKDGATADVHALAAKLERCGAVVRVVPGDARDASSVAARVLGEVRRCAEAASATMSYVAVCTRMQGEVSAMITSGTRELGVEQRLGDRR